MVKITNHKYKHEMKLRNIGSMESSELVTVAALFIILAGMYFARTIVAPILLALFIIFMSAAGLPCFLAGTLACLEIAIDYIA